MDVSIDLEIVNVIFPKIGLFISLGIAVSYALNMISRKWQKPRPLVFLALSVLMITTATYDLVQFLDYRYYRSIFQPLSEDLFHLRYSFSITFRLLIIIVAVGLLSLKEFYRKLVIGISLFTITTIYWKHPFYVFENIAIISEQQHFGTTVTELMYPSLPWFSLFFYVTCDLIFALVLVYYFMLSSTKEIFNPHEDKDSKIPVSS